MGRQIVLGLVDIHASGVAHLDFQLANILVDASGLKIAGFACAHLAREHLTSSQGTPTFMAPEVRMLSHQMGDHRQADMWSLGVLLFMLYFGFPPFGAASDTDKC